MKTLQQHKHIVSLALVLLYLLTLIPTTAHAAGFASSYNADAAVTYAENHWDDGVGVCDQFVKACLAAGGVEILAGGVDAVRYALVDAGLGSECTLTISDDGVHAIQAENPQVQAGDVLFIYCEECAKSIHTVLVGGYSQEGYLYTYGHNPGWDRVDWLGNFKHTTDDGDQHAKCYQFYVVTMDRAPYSHAHSFTSDLYEEAHPHKMYAQCSCNAKYYLGWNATVSYCTTCNPPLGDVPVVTATADPAAMAISLEWSTVEGALEYQVWRSRSENGTYFNIYSAMGTRMSNKSVTMDTAYYYKVVAVLEKDAQGNAVRSATSDIVSCVLTDGAVAAIGETRYQSVSQALDAAVPGDTVKLLQNVDASSELFLIQPGITLDLQAYTLSVNYLVGLSGSTVTGTVVDKNGQNGAKLVVAQDSVILSADAPDGTNAGYKIIPVWNGDHYIFSQATISNQSFAVTGDSSRVNFLPNFSSYIKNSLFKPDGCADNDVSVIISVSWMESGIRVTQEYFYTTSLIIDAMNNKGLYAVMTGCDTKEDLLFRISIVTDCGVAITSQDYIYNDYK